MKRFIRYLYEYENEKRIRNVGFVKIEAGYGETVVNIQAKGFHNSDERKLVLYLFYEEDKALVGLVREEINLTTPVLNWNQVFTAEDVGGEEIYSKICGVLIESGSGRQMAATWNDGCVDVSRLRLFAPEDLEQENCVHEYEEREAEKLHRKVTKISRKDISKLPRCEWKLANNRFLVHGHNNFHHLLLIEDGNYLKLGVPGIYHIEEAKCADTFGFGEFISAEEIGMDSTDQEMFGYWCRPVRGGKNW